MTKKQPVGAAQGQPGPAQATSANFAGLPTELAQQTVHLHCAMVWPNGMHCNDCRASFRRWAVHILRHAGWTETQIASLEHEPTDEAPDTTEKHADDLNESKRLQRM